MSPRAVIVVAVALLGLGWGLATQWLGEPGARSSAPKDAPASLPDQSAPKPPPASPAIPRPPHRKFTNQLVGSTSPYLLQHAHNPVNWRPWGPEALAEAREADKPIFLSVGYSTCHWCHVMEREAFENETIARLLNTHFIPIKVDREERPDIDEQYLLATQLLTGRSGWPNSVWLTPEGEPWMAGSYFPTEDFERLLIRLIKLWTNDRTRVEQQAEQVAEALKESVRSKQDVQFGEPDRQLIARTISALRDDYDIEYGGFGTDQKFPPHSSIQLLIDQYRRTSDPSLLELVTGTLDAMASGGLRDHVGGGFHRYATDRQWRIPHFEKMLYDNALLIRHYTDGYLLTHDERYRRIVAEIYEWMKRDMTDQEGAFYSAYDSETDGKEGDYYVWSLREVVDALGDVDGRLFADVYGITSEGNRADDHTGKPNGTNLPFLPRSLQDYARLRNLDEEQLSVRMDAARERLLLSRNERAPPHLDDKLLSGWNGLAISALAYAGRNLDEPRYVDAAVRAADFVLGKMVDDDGQLLRTCRHGKSNQPGFLTDYSFMCDGTLELHAATDSDKWMEASKKLADAMLTDFEDQDDHAFFFSSANHDELLVRTKNLYASDNLPTGNAVAIRVLQRLAALTGREEYTRAAREAVAALHERMRQSPRGVECLIAAAANQLEIGAESSAAVNDLPDAGLAEHPLAIDLYPTRKQVEPGGTLDLAIRISIDEGWHLYGPNPELESLVPTSIRLGKSTLAKSGELKAPESIARYDRTLASFVNVLEGTVWFKLPVHISRKARRGPITLQVDVVSQACDDNRCLLPKTSHLELEIYIQEAGDERQRLEPALQGEDAESTVGPASRRRVGPETD